MNDIDKDAHIAQLQARIKELETAMKSLSNSALNVINYWRNKYESTK